MKVSLSWLNQYVDLRKQSEAEISHALTMVGFEVEDVLTSGLKPMDHIVVGEIVSFEGHPNADRLSLCQVDVGDGVNRSIVCGAKNFKQNDRVIVALPGAILPGNFKIKESKLRGVVSQGMLCSEKELGVGEDHDGIAILAHRPALGTSVNDLYPKPDTVFDVEITPNRPDALSHLGIARELSAWFKLDITYPDAGKQKISAEGSLIDSLECYSPEICPHYRGYSIRNVKVEPSPSWLKAKLTAVGLRPINNIVDATNYILHETGQPLHAFDVSKIGGGQIIVRQARDKETIVTLDEKKRTLHTQDLVIADAEKALVIAGVMGSVDAEVDNGTTNIFLESAYFNSRAVRKTSRRLGLSTDSSYRFERGIDPNGAEYAALLCIDLIIELAGGELMGPPLVFGDAPMTKREIILNPQFIRDRFGFEITNEAIKTHLESLELSIDENQDDEGELSYQVSIPSYRLDLYRPVDLVEEVIRMYGSDKIPQGRVKATATLSEDDLVVGTLRNVNSYLVGQGFSEALHYTLRSEEELRRWYGHSQANTLAVANPLAQDASHLRPSLIPGLLDCLSLNLKRHNHPVRLFETGRVFKEFDGRIFEMVSIGFLISIEKEAAWKNREAPDFYSTSRLAIDLLGFCGITVDSSSIKPIKDANAWQEGHSGELTFGSHELDVRFGLLSPAMTREWDIRFPVLAGSINLLPAVLKRPRERSTFKPFSSFPPAVRDLAIICDVTDSAGAVKSFLKTSGEKVVEGKDIDLEGVEAFDVYVGGGLDTAKKSIAFNLTFRSAERTLNDKEVNQLFDQIQKEVEQNSSYSIRK